MKDRRRARGAISEVIRRRTGVPREPKVRALAALTVQPIRWSAARTRLAFVDGQELTPDASLTRGIDDLVAIREASDADEWRDRIVNLPL